MTKRKFSFTTKSALAVAIAAATATGSAMPTNNRSLYEDGLRQPEITITSPHSNLLMEPVNTEAQLLAYHSSHSSHSSHYSHQSHASHSSHSSGYYN